MLTQTLLRFTLLGEDWILYLLLAASLLSVAVMLDRLAYFGLRGVSGVDELAALLRSGEMAAAKKKLEGARGMEGEVLRAALEMTGSGPGAVEEVIEGGIIRQRLHYERFLAFLGTLGNNAPFIGLLGTVLGIVRAFRDLASATPGAAAQGPQTVMAGISQALVATAVGLVVALPAVVAFNGFQRWLKTITARTNTLGHALVAHLKGVDERPPSAREAGRG
ncbi:MAG: MotA/TolQ/ExbB proton channel family protein [Deltaproteobacteria bacterium]